MKISKNTIDILKNFSTINQSIFVSPGNTLKTMAIAKNILSSAVVDETFETEFAIYNLNEFLQTVSVFDNPEFEFHEKCVHVREAGKKRDGSKYYYCNKALITYPTKDGKISGDIVAEFVVTEQMISKIVKMGSVLGVNDLFIIGDSNGVSLIIKDKKNEASNDYEIEITDTPPSAEFKALIRLENLKLIQTDYKVNITDKMIAFTSKDGKIFTAIALEV